MSEEPLRFTSVGRISDSFKNAGLFNSESGGFLTRNIFSNAADPEPFDIQITWEFREPSPPTRWDKIKGVISRAFHPITKYRIRIVNTDYWDWD